MAGSEATRTTEAKATDAGTDTDTDTVKTANKVAGKVDEGTTGTARKTRRSAERQAEGKEGRPSVMTPANVVTCARLALMPIWLLLAEAARAGSAGTAPHDGSALAWAACGLYILISLTDKLDGYLARSRSEVTDFGKVMDPLADKVSVSLGLLWLTETGLAPSWMLLVVLTREFLVSGLRMLVASKGTIVAASSLGRAKTATTMVGICALIVFATLPLDAAYGWMQVAGDILLWVAMALTAWSGLDYARACWPAVAGSGEGSTAR